MRFWPERSQRAPKRSRSSSEPRSRTLRFPGEGSVTGRMLFNSLHFLAFFPIVTVVLFLLSRWRQAWIPFLLAASVYFYAAFIPKFIFILIALILIDFF